MSYTVNYVMNYVMRLWLLRIFIMVFCLVTKTVPRVFCVFLTVLLVVAGCSAESLESLALDEALT